MRQLALMLLLATSASAEALPPGFTHLSRIAPQIAQDIRYARSFNFTGDVVPGYEAAECILTTQTAQALIRVEARLADQGYGLVVYDCYRPRRAVAHFADWAALPAASDPPSPGAAAQGRRPPHALSPAQVFHPGFSRAQLIPGGYIARRSGHSVGHTVDVGLRVKGIPVPLPDFAGAGPCDAPADQRAGEDPGLTPDMGTAFDCFSPLSAIDAPVPAQAQANRKTLRRAMEAEGFEGYSKEWWHFRNTADPATQAQDFPVTGP